MTTPAPLAGIGPADVFLPTTQSVTVAWSESTDGQPLVLLIR
jgi:hypothetical protein